MLSSLYNEQQCSSFALGLRILRYGLMISASCQSAGKRRIPIFWTVAESLPADPDALQFIPPKLPADSNQFLAFVVLIRPR